MANDNRSIVITLKLEQSSQEENNPTDIKKVDEKVDKGATQKAIASYAAMEITRIAVSEAINWGEYYWNRSLMLNDDYLGQRFKQRTMYGISSGLNFVGSAASGAIAGSMILPGIGTAVGAVLGALTSALGMVREGVQGNEQQQLTLSQMNEQLSYTRSRVGYSLEAASIGEDL